MNTFVLRPLEVRVVMQWRRRTLVQVGPRLRVWLRRLCYRHLRLRLAERHNVLLSSTCAAGWTRNAQRMLYSPGYTVCVDEIRRAA